MRLGFLVGALALAVLVPFLVWGDTFAAWFSRDGSRAWLEGYGGWAWAAGMVLLLLDLVLPLPNTVVIAALGYVHGPVWGGLAGAAGSMLPGLAGYGLCRAFGRGVARRLAGERELARWEGAFRERGGWIVAWSRWLPLVPEVVACAAGLAGMPWRGYVAALACGSVPLGFAYAALGSMGHAHPAVAWGASVVVPPVLWALVHLRWRAGKAEGD
jgi:uncharacterized membrane protein YdjX (TVP38/TMEM64 family)